MTTIREQSSGRSAAIRIPTGPPQSWTTNVASRTSSLLEQRRRRPRRGGRRCTSRSRSACRSGRSRGGRARCSGSRRRGAAAMTLRHRNDQVGSPWKSTTGGPRPRRCGRAAGRPVEVLRLPGEIREACEALVGRADGVGHCRLTLAEQLREAQQVARATAEPEPALQERAGRGVRALADLDEVAPAGLEGDVGAGASPAAARVEPLSTTRCQGSASLNRHWTVKGPWPLTTDGSTAGSTSRSRGPGSPASGRDPARARRSRPPRHLDPSGRASRGRGQVERATPGGISSIG